MLLCQKQRLKQACVIKAAHCMLSLGAVCHAVLAGSLPTAGRATPSRLLSFRQRKIEVLSVCARFQHCGVTGILYDPRHRCTISSRTNVSRGVAHEWNSATTTAEQQLFSRSREERMILGGQVRVLVKLTTYGYVNECTEQA
jgi:hypothetical protein